MKPDRCTKRDKLVTRVADLEDVRQGWRLAHRVQTRVFPSKAWLFAIALWGQPARMYVRRPIRISLGSDRARPVRRNWRWSSDTHPSAQSASSTISNPASDIEPEATEGGEAPTEEAELAPANDNSPAEPLPATGTGTE
jgi:hypothetical protein